MAVTLFKLESNLGVAVGGFHDTVVLSFHLTPGDWVLIGRVVLNNFDGDDQKASAQISSAGKPIDRADVTISGRGSQVISLQGVMRADVNQPVKLLAATFKGGAAEGSLIAIPIDTFTEEK